MPNYAGWFSNYRWINVISQLRTCRSYIAPVTKSGFGARERETLVHNFLAYRAASV